MSPPTTSFRHASSQQLAEALQAARNYTLSLFDIFAAAGLDQANRVPQLATLNPPLWELGHIAWFAEWFILREAQSSHPADARYNCLLTRGDDLFDSNLVAHRSRWSLELPSTGALKTYCREVLDRVLDKLSRAANTDAALYPYRLALAHEDMHGEAFLYTLQTLGLAVDPGLTQQAMAFAAPSQISFPGVTLEMGRAAPGGGGPRQAAPGRSAEGGPRAGFVFDNEMSGHPVYVPAFQIDSTLIGNAQYADFLADGGYQNRQFWSPAGSAWLMQQERSSPRYWQRDGGQWRCIRFGRLCTLAASEPVRHVNLYEAQAYCAWAGRRLATEAEWEYAAASGHPGFRWGHLWEWTASPFEPYPGFEAGPYREYSRPWFITHQVLRGASFATPERLRSARFRNFYMPGRDDIFAGFRTCAW